MYDCEMVPVHSALNLTNPFRHCVSNTVSLRLKRRLADRPRVLCETVALSMVLPRAVYFLNIRLWFSRESKEFKVVQNEQNEGFGSCSCYTRYSVVPDGADDINSL